MLLNLIINLFTKAPLYYVNSDRLVKVDFISRYVAVYKDKRINVATLQPDNINMAPQISEYTHSPYATLDYGIDWSVILNPNEVITNSIWYVDAGLIKSLEQISGNVTALFISGGVVGTMYKLVNVITTSQGRGDARTINLYCTNK